MLLPPLRSLCGKLSEAAFKEKKLDERLYWLWLQRGLGFGANAGSLLATYGSAKAVYEAGSDDWRLSGAFSEGFFGLKSSGLERLGRNDIHEGEKILEYCENNYIKIVTPQSELYPQKLLKLANYPLVLFYRGDISCLENALAIAVVGTRKPSAYGIRAAEKLAFGLAQSKSVIVSGGALGIDSIAHKSAIKAGSKTVLVMGCGHDTSYLAENAALREEVTRHGATVTEYPPRTVVGKGYFPLRNRIISGISDGVVIVEANLKSGTLNTAAHAKKQQREIFAVPGDISSVSYAGSNKLIIDGAKAVFSAEDVLQHFEFEAAAKKELSSVEPSVPFEGIDVFPYGENKPIHDRRVVKKAQKDSGKPQKNEPVLKNKEISLEGVSKNAEMVYNVMKSGCTSLDSITRESSLPVRKVLIALTELEIGGYVSSTGGNNYVCRG